MTVSLHAGQTDVGQSRAHNEDSIAVEPPLFAVADGVGGAQSGERASLLAITVMRSHAGSLSTIGDDSAAMNAMAEAVEACNAEIHATQAHDPELAGMATTLTALVLRPDGTCVLGHVGDSRAYRIFPDGECIQITEDHSVVGELVRSGQLTPEEAADHPRRNVITRALGSEAHVTVDTAVVTSEVGTWLLVCSDGLTAHVSDDEIGAAVVAMHGNPARGAAALVALANERGGSDNISVVMVCPHPDDRLEIPPPVDGSGRAAPVGGLAPTNPAEISGEIDVISIDRTNLPRTGEDTVTVDEHTYQAAIQEHAIAREQLQPGKRRRQVPGTPSPAPARSWPVRRIAAAVAIVAISFLGGSWAWSQSYYIDTTGSGMITARHGFPLLGLNRAWRTTDIPARDLSTADRQKYVDRPTLRSKADVQRILRLLPELAGRCDDLNTNTVDPPTTRLTDPAC